MDSYTDKPTKVRVFLEDDHYAIDGVDDSVPVNFTEAIWTQYDGKEFGTREEAHRHVEEFANAHGWEHLPVIDW